MKRNYFACAALLLVPMVFVGCGGDSGSSGSNSATGSQITPDSISGVFTTTTARAAGDTLDVSFTLTGATLTGAARLTPAAGGAPVNVTLSNASYVNKVVAFTATFAGTDYVVRGTLSGTVISGSLQIGANSADAVSLTKVADTTTNVSGTWNGTYSYNAGVDSGTSGTVSATFTQASGSNVFSGPGSANYNNQGAQTVTFNGSVFGSKVQTGFAITSTAPTLFTGTVNGRSFSGTFINSFGSGTFSTTKQ